MNQNQNIFYKAYAARDARFDGVFFIGVTSTGIYCRPICSAKLPKIENCRFFKSAAEAETEFFRPCLRCRPELAPGYASSSEAHRMANLLMYGMREGEFSEEMGLEEVALQFGLSSRHMRRIIKKTFGVSPLALVLTRRLLLAKQLLTETNLTIIEVAFSCGFSSLRRFNDAFKKRYKMPPSYFRKEKNKNALHDYITLQLNYRPPFDWEGLLNFLATRSLMGIEHVSENVYSRTVQIGKSKGWVSVSHIPEKHALKVEVSSSLTPCLSSLLPRLRDLFDLDARPDVINTQLSQDPLLAKAVLNNPGLRVPGAFDGFELAVRAILGQQTTVRAATTLAGRFSKAFGEPISTIFSNLHYLCPTPQRMAIAQVEELIALGIIRSRAQSIIALAKEIAANRLKLEANVNPEWTILQLIAIPGIGKWTAHYIAMRALRWPDAFPKEDLAMRKRLGGLSAKKAEELSQAWRPWRSYALLHLWQSKTPLL